MPTRSTQVIRPQGFNANLAPDAFAVWGRHYYLARQCFKCDVPFSPVPYFLLCRCIELSIKSFHLAGITQEDAKKQFGHDLMSAYDALEPSRKILDASELAVLTAANAIYVGKDFEYFDPEDALRAFDRYPDLDALDAIARKLSDAANAAI